MNAKPGLPKLRLLLIILITTLFLTGQSGLAVAEGLRTPLEQDQKVSDYKRIQANPEVSDEDKIKNAIDTYFYLRYEGQKNLQVNDFSFLVDSDPRSQEWLKKEKDRQEIELFIAKAFQQNYTSYEYYLDYISFEVDGPRAVVQLLEGNEVISGVNAQEVSKLANLEHTLKLKKTGKGWVISQDEYEDELARLMAVKSKEEILDTVRHNLETNFQLQGADVTNTLPSDSISPLFVNHALDRTAVANYADTWWDGRNESYVRDYYPADCTNFVSQSLYEGTSHTMSVPDNWYKWYYDDNKDGSGGWINVQYQRNFLVTNVEEGPYGNSVSLGCSLYSGDIVQLSDDGGSSWFHEAVIVDIVNDDCRFIQNFLVDAHDTDHYHYNLSNWSYYTLRFIHVGGWRN